MEKVINPDKSIGFKGTFVESMLDKAINGIVENQWKILCGSNRNFK